MVKVNNRQGDVLIMIHIKHLSQQVVEQLKADETFQAMASAKDNHAGARERIQEHV